MTEQEKATRLVQAYLDMKMELQPVLDALKLAEKAAKTAVLALGEDVQVDGGRARIVAGYERTSWDGAALAFLAKRNPEILDAARVTSVRPYVAIEV